MKLFKENFLCNSYGTGHHAKGATWDGEIFTQRLHNSTSNYCHTLAAQSWVGPTLSPQGTALSLALLTALAELQV